MSATMGRKYELKQRAERQDETRMRIVEAAIELHQTIGPTATTVSHIAERAGVGRVTVYRHFPDELTLAYACSGRYFERNPYPDPAEWDGIDDPAERLRAALGVVYAYHAQTAPMIGFVLAEARDYEVMDPYHAHWARLVETLLGGWGARGGARARLRAAIALALSFDTWRTLVRDQGLSPREAIETAVRGASAQAL
jgi:AcrR family transcriptional regulator